MCSRIGDLPEDPLLAQAGRQRPGTNAANVWLLTKVCSILTSRFLDRRVILTEYADKIIGGIDDFVVDLPPPVAA